MNGFARSTYDLVFGVADRRMRIFVTLQPITLKQLTRQLEVSVGTGGGAISLAVERKTTEDRFPSGVLISADTHPVGMVSENFGISQMFGICTDQCELLEAAEEISSVCGEDVTYETSYMLR